MIISRQLPSFCLAALFLSFSGGAHALAQPEQTRAEIRRTSFGVPHIRADDERGLGYGIGYAYAQDNLCLMANEVLTVNAQRSQYFGAEGQTLEQRDNLSSDLFFSWLNTPQAVAAFWQAQTPAMRERCRVTWRATTASWRSARPRACPSNAGVTGCGRWPPRTW